MHGRPFLVVGASDICSSGFLRALVPRNGIEIESYMDSADISELNELPEFCRKPNLILGCGNVFFGDDAFGCAVVDYIESHGGAPDSVYLLDAGTGVRNLLFTICLSPVRPKRLLIIDAVDVGRTPGEVFELNPADIPPVKIDDFSMHQIPTSNMLRELQDHCGMEVRVLVCQTGELPGQVAPGLSEPVQRAVAAAVEWITREYFNDSFQEVAFSRAATAT